MLTPKPPMKENYGQAGVRLYQKYCMSCHGADRKGTGNFPTLINVQERYHDAISCPCFLPGGE